MLGQSPRPCCESRSSRPDSVSSSKAAAASAVRITDSGIASACGRATGTSSAPRSRSAASAARSRARPGSSRSPAVSKAAGAKPTRSPRRSGRGAYGNGASITEGSRPSAPRIASKTSAQSSALRAIGPSLSSDQHRAMAPAPHTRPKVGRRPVTPQRIDGETIEPQVSEPMAKGSSPAATAEAGPAEEPLLPCSRSQGLRVWPPNHWSPMARAPRVSLAQSTAPAASSFATTVAVSSSSWSR